MQETVAEKAGSIMQVLTTEKLTVVIPAISERVLTERLPVMTAEKLYSIPSAVLFSSLPNAPTEQLVGEVLPSPAPGLSPPVVVSTTPTGASYLAIRSVSGEWVIVVATPIPVDKLLIKTKRELQNVRLPNNTLLTQRAPLALSPRD